MIIHTANEGNEQLSKFKLLSAYGSPGSILHTTYGSILVSCIEEWGFINQVNEWIERSVNRNDPEEYVRKEAADNSIIVSNDHRLLQELKARKGLFNLDYLILIPDVELTRFNTISNGRTQYAINSTFLPKIFISKNKLYNTYNYWYKLWCRTDESKTFHPPKYKTHLEGGRFFISELTQDNLVLLCRNGHISDFPWSQYLRWKKDNLRQDENGVDLFNQPFCCPHPEIYVTEQAANSSGFDGKWLKCKSCDSSVSLKGIMSVKIICPGHKPWEIELGSHNNYFGSNTARNQVPPREQCRNEIMKVALTTGNNLYFSRILSSIYMPKELFINEEELKILELERKKELAIKEEDFNKAENIKNDIKKIKEKIIQNEGPIGDVTSESDRDVYYRFKEYSALTSKTEQEINIDYDLVIKDVTENLNDEFAPFFSRLLRIDNLKITSIQLDFSRVEPIDSDSVDATPKNIFRSNPENVKSYPAIENYGEGIFFGFNEQMIENFTWEDPRYQRLFEFERNEFAKRAENFAKEKDWQLFLIHTFSHLIMRELEFRCGYPTASIAERLYISNTEGRKMYGCLIYTTEGAEGSMGGIIAQTSKNNLNSLIKSAFVRSTICNSDPLCWESPGQGLFDLNLACCFSCGLVSETSCELRNIYLDRRVLVDSLSGYFKNIIAND